MLVQKVADEIVQFEPQDVVELEAPLYPGGLFYWMHRVPVLLAFKLGMNLAKGTVSLVSDPSPATRRCLLRLFLDVELVKTRHRVVNGRARQVRLDCHLAFVLDDTGKVTGSTVTKVGTNLGRRVAHFFFFFGMSAPLLRACLS